MLKTTGNRKPDAHEISVFLKKVVTPEARLLMTPPKNLPIPGFQYGLSTQERTMARLIDKLAMGDKISAESIMSNQHDPEDIYLEDEAAVVIFNAIAWWKQANGATVIPTAWLCDLLSKTNLPSAEFARLLKLPYPSLYVDMLNAHLSGVKCFDNGTLVSCIDLHGVYLFNSDLCGLKTIFFVFVGKLHGTDEWWCYNTSLATPEEVDEVIIGSSQLLDACQARGNKWWADHDIEGSQIEFYPFELALNILIYMNADRSMSREVNDLDTAKRYAKRARTAKEQIEAGKKLRNSRNYILLGPETALSTCKTESGVGTYKSTHWRRGHFHAVPCGKGGLSRKIKWFQPILVNADKMTSGVKIPAPKKYILTNGKGKCS